MKSFYHVMYTSSVTGFLIFLKQGHYIYFLCRLKDLKFDKSVSFQYDSESISIVKLVWFRKIQLNMNKEIIKLTICYLKDTKCFSESVIWIIFCFFICYYCCYFIASWRWFLICIHSNFGSMFFALSSLEFSLNPFMSYIYFQCLFF